MSDTFSIAVFAVLGTPHIVRCTGRPPQKLRPRNASLLSLVEPPTSSTPSNPCPQLYGFAVSPATFALLSDTSCPLISVSVCLCQLP